MQVVNSLNELREQGRMTWSEGECGWLAAPAEILNALSLDGFESCKRELTTSRRDGRPAGGVWQGVNARTGTVASAIWVNRPGWQQAIVFIDIDGESLRDPRFVGPELRADQAARGISAVGCGASNEGTSHGKRMTQGGPWSTVE
jgi:hypothetical protein